MATYTYLHKTLSEPHVLTAAINPDCPTGLTWQDYLDGKWILLSGAQLSFYQANPTASAKEIIEMQLTPPPPEPTLEEARDIAISQIDQEVENRLNDLFPVRELLDNVVRVLANAGDQYISDYIETRDNISMSATMAKDAVRESNCVSEINTVVDSINELSIEIVTRPPEIGIGGKIRG